MYLLSTPGGVAGYYNLNLGKPTGAENKSIEINMPFSNYGYLFGKWISPALPRPVSLDQEYNWLFSFYGNSTGTAYFYVEFLLYRSGIERLIERSSRSEPMIENISLMLWQYHFKRPLSFNRGDRVGIAIYAQAGTEGAAEFYYDCAAFPSYFSDPIETRYMRDDDTTVNGLAAKQLGTAQTTSYLYSSTTVTSVALESIFYPTDFWGLNINLTRYPSGTNQWDCVNDAKGSPNDSTDYVRSDDDDDEDVDIYANNATGYTLTGGKRIAFLYLTYRGHRSGIRPYYSKGGYVMKSGSVEVKEGTILDAAWTTYIVIINQDPATSLEWTQSGVRAMHFGCWATSSERLGSWYYGYVTQVFVETYIYTDQTVYMSINVAKRSSGGSETAIGTSVAQWSGSWNTINLDQYSFYDKTGSYTPGSTALAATDSIVVRVYSKVGAGAWTLQQTFTTEQLGAASLDVNAWTLHYYVGGRVDTSNAYMWFGYGASIEANTRIEGFAWTTAITKTWTTAATWQINLIARQWTNSASWQFNLIARQWTTPAAWEFSLITRQWSTPAVWMFNLLARQWNTAATWTIQLLTRQWQSTAIWSFDLINEIIGAYWHTSGIWSIILSLDTMTIHDLAIMLVLGLIFFPMCIILVTVWLRRRH